MITTSCIAILIVVLLFLFMSKNIAHPIVLFLGIWLACLFCASLRLYNMKEFSDKGVILILTGLTAFCVGCFISMSRRNFRIRPPKSFSVPVPEITFNVSWHAVYILLFASLAGILILDILALKALKKGVSYSYIRNMYYGYGSAPKLIKSTFLSTYINWISVPALYALIPVAMINLFETKNIFRRKKHLLFSIVVFLSAFMYIFGSAGRFMLIFLVVQMATVFQVYHKKLSAKFKKRIFILISAVIVIFFLISSIRASGASGKKVNTFYAYLSIPVYLLDYWTEKVENAPHLYGGAFLYGILTFLNYFTSKVGFHIPLYEKSYNMIQVTQNGWVEIFPHEWYNAYVSMFYYFYIDFGITGVVIGCMFFGYLCHEIYHIAFIKKNKNALLFYLIMIQCIVCSIVRWQLGTITLVLTLFFEWFIIPKKYRIEIPKIRFTL